jgi:hypothetical protein
MRIPGTLDRPEPDDDTPRMAVFLRGLTIGALVGAAIAGSALWERARRRGGNLRAEPVPAPDASATVEPEDARPT